MKFILVGREAVRAGFCRVRKTARDSTVSSTRKRMRGLRCATAFPLLLGVSNRPACFVTLGSSTNLIGGCTVMGIRGCRVITVKSAIDRYRRSCAGLVCGGKVGARTRSAESMRALATGVAGVTRNIVSNSSRCCVVLRNSSRVFSMSIMSFVSVVQFGIKSRIAIRCGGKRRISAILSLGKGTDRRVDAGTTGRRRTRSATKSSTRARWRGRTGGEDAAKRQGCFFFSS